MTFHLLMSCVSCVLYRWPIIRDDLYVKLIQCVYAFLFILTFYFAPLARLASAKFAER